MIFKIYDVENSPSELEKQEVVDFLFTNLEKYGDPKDQILKALNYAVKAFDSFGGFVIAAFDKDEMIGATILNHTGMGGYIPENILVYIAIHDKCRGKGIGRKLMEKVIDHAEGDIALHVEANNPAKFLYEKLGFTNPYLEMRLKK